MNINENLKANKELYTGYTYYVPMYSSEHFMYAHEIAEYLMTEVGWVTGYGKRPTKYVSLYLDSLVEARNEKPVLYENKFGLSKVYSRNDIEQLINYLSSMSEAQIQDSKGNTYKIYKNPNNTAVSMVADIPAA